MPLVILDRDGVINRTIDGYLLKPDHWEPLPGSLEAIARLHHAGYAVAVATNQAALSRGLFDMAMVNAIHQRMTRLAEAAGGRIDAIAICPHNPEKACACRKPRPGMLLELMDRFGVTTADTVFIGDSLSDIQSGVAAGCATWLVRSGNGEETARHPARPPEVQIADDLAAVVEQLLFARADGMRPPPAA